MREKFRQRLLRSLTLSKSVKSIRPLFVSLALASLLISGCNAGKNLLENSRFEDADPISSGWSLEGGGSVKKTADGAVLRAEGDSTPFIYQGVSAKVFGKERLFTLSAWVSSDTPDSAYLEFSNRQGADIRSEAHPGDGSWRLLKLTARAPEGSQKVEFRIRLYRGGSLSIREASFSAGAASTLEKRSLDGIVLGASWAKWALEAALIIAALSAAAVFMPYRDREEARVFEGFLLLLILSNIMLVAGKSFNAGAASNAAWVLLSLWLIRRALQGAFKRKKRGNDASFMKRVPSAFAALCLFATVAIVYALKNGDVKGAEKAANFAYLLFLTTAAALALEKTLSKAWEALRSGKEGARTRRKPEMEEETLLEMAEAGKKGDGVL